MSRFQVMPPLTPEEWGELATDIKANGVLQPILEDENGEVIDGHNRKAIAEELGMRCPSIKCPPNLTDAEKRTLAYGVNLHRRHLSREQKRQVIANSLMADPELSNRQHGERTGASHVTVGAVRDEMEDGGQLDHHDVRVGKDGVAQPAKVTTTTRTTEATKIERDIDLNTGEIIPAGQPAKPKPEPENPIAEFADAMEASVETSPDAAQREADVKAVADFVAGDEDLILMRWQANFFKSVTRITEVMEFAEAEVVAKADDEALEAAVAAVSRLSAWLDRINTARPKGLSLVQGGKR